MNDFWFRISLILIFSGLSVIRIICKRRAGALGEGLFPKQEGPLQNSIRAVFGVPLFSMFFLYLVLPDALPQTYMNLQCFARFAGISGGILAVTVIGLSHKALGRNYSSTVLIKKNHSLVTSGVYRYIRHPMYSAYLLLFISAFLVSENWLIGITGGGIILSLMTLRLKREEALLKERFGREYKNYMQRAGRFLPLVKPVVKWLILSEPSSHLSKRWWDNQLNELEDDEG